MAIANNCLHKEYILSVNTTQSQKITCTIKVEMIKESYNKDQMIKKEDKIQNKNHGKKYTIY